MSRKLYAAVLSVVIVATVIMFVLASARHDEQEDGHGVNTKSFKSVATIVHDTIIIRDTVTNVSGKELSEVAFPEDAGYEHAYEFLFTDGLRDTIFFQKFIEPPRVVNDWWCMNISDDEKVWYLMQNVTRINYAKKKKK